MEGAGEGEREEEREGVSESVSWSTCEVTLGEVERAGEVARVEGEADEEAEEEEDVGEETEGVSRSVPWTSCEVTSCFLVCSSRRETGAGASGRAEGPGPLSDSGVIFCLLLDWASHREIEVGKLRVLGPWCGSCVCFLLWDERPSGMAGELPRRRAGEVKPLTGPKGSVCFSICGLGDMGGAMGGEAVRQ